MPTTNVNCRHGWMALIFWVQDLPEWSFICHALCEQNLERRRLYVTSAACHKLDLDEEQLLCFSVNNISPQVTNLSIIFGIRGSEQWVNCWWSQTIVVSGVQSWLEIVTFLKSTHEHSVKGNYTHRKGCRASDSITSQWTAHDHGSCVTSTGDLY